MYRIGVLIKKFNISRTTLLYYDSINLLNPSTRTEKNYRLYSNEDVKKLELILIYKEMGVNLKDIRMLLDNKKDKKKILEDVLIRLDSDINLIQNKRIKMLKTLKNIKSSQSSKVSVFADVIKSLGIEHTDFHVIFEKKDIKEHREFLRFLGLSEDEIKKILKNLKIF
jgi:DNA-binding transcriptional MerR regulator